MKRKTNPPKFDRCVRAVKKRGGAANAYAVCTAARTRKNPANDSEFDAAAKASQEFHGTDSVKKVFDIVTEVFEFDSLGDCGELVKLEIIPKKRGPIVDLTQFDGARLAMSPKGELPQLYVEGGNQDVDLDVFGIETVHAQEVLGDLKFVTYYTIKHHLGRQGGKANYRHKLNDGEKIRRGTNPKNRPTVCYDALNNLISIWGGEYEILPEGIDN